MKVAGVYAVWVNNYSSNTHSRLAMYVKPADASGEVHLCEAHSPNSKVLPAIQTFLQKSQQTCIDELNTFLLRTACNHTIFFNLIGYRSSTCMANYELNTADEVYVKAEHPQAGLFSPPGGRLFNMFKAEILYKKL